MEIEVAGRDATASSTASGSTAAEPAARRVRRPHRRLAGAAAVAIALLLLAYVAISIVVASLLTEGSHKPLPVSAAGIWPSHENVAFPSRGDHLTLKGWLFRSGSGSGRSVIFVSGRLEPRVDMGYGTPSLARELLQHGYDVLLFDVRGTSQSAGARSTLGTREPRDLLGAVDFMKQRGYDLARMAIIGDSMGAAVVLEAAPQLPKVGALVSDSAYAALRPLLERQLPANSHLPGFFNWGIITAGQILFGINPDLRPLDAVRSVPNRAFLFIQGTADHEVPPADATALRRASANPQSELLLVPGAGHVKSYQREPDRYLQILFQFIDAQIAAHTAG